METSLREPRPEKVAVVDEVRSRLEASSAALLTEYRGLAVSDLETLRRALRDVGGDYKIYKNTLVRRAVSESGLSELEQFLEGPTAIAFVRGDVAAVARVLRDFARTNPNLVVKGGLIGSSLIDSGSAAALAELPSREVLLAQFAGALAAPMQRFAGLLAAVPQRFAYALAALGRLRGESEPAPAAAVETDEAPTEDPAPDAAATEVVVSEDAVADNETDSETADAETADAETAVAEPAVAEPAVAETAVAETADAESASDESSDDEQATTESDSNES